MNLDEKLNSSKCNLSLEPKMMTVHESIQELQHCMCPKVGYKGSFGVSPSVIFLKRLDIKLDKHV